MTRRTKLSPADALRHAAANADDLRAKDYKQQIITALTDDPDGRGDFSGMSTILSMSRDARGPDRQFFRGGLALVLKDEALIQSPPVLAQALTIVASLDDPFLDKSVQDLESRIDAVPRTTDTPFNPQAFTDPLDGVRSELQSYRIRFLGEKLPASADPAAPLPHPAS